MKQGNRIFPHSPLKQRNTTGFGMKIVVSFSNLLNLERCLIKLIESIVLQI